MLSVVYAFKIDAFFSSTVTFLFMNRSYVTFLMLCSNMIQNITLPVTSQLTAHCCPPCLHSGRGTGSQTTAKLANHHQSAGSICTVGTLSSRQLAAEYVGFLHTYYLHTPGCVETKYYHTNRTCLLAFLSYFVLAFLNVFCISFETVPLCVCVTSFSTFYLNVHLHTLGNKAYLNERETSILLWCQQSVCLPILHEFCLYVG